MSTQPQRPVFDPAEFLDFAISAPFDWNAKYGLQTWEQPVVCPVCKSTDHKVHIVGTSFTTGTFRYEFDFEKHEVRKDDIRGLRVDDGEITHAPHVGTHFKCAAGHEFTVNFRSVLGDAKIDTFTNDATFRAWAEAEGKTIDDWEHEEPADPGVNRVLDRNAADALAALDAGEIPPL